MACGCDNCTNPECNCADSSCTCENCSCDCSTSDKGEQVMAETTQDTSMTISQMRDFIVDKGRVGANTVAGLTDAQVKAAVKKIMQDIEKSVPATRATTPPVTSRNKGGPIQKRPQMMHGGAYKGKKHAYTAGGSVNNLKIMKK